MNASLKLVGDHFKLTKRQRLAVLRNASAWKDVQNRFNKECKGENLEDETILIDGFNLLITIESALSGGYIFIGVDGGIRDLSSIHWSYKRVI
jgi:hypothetical protein